MTRAHPYNREDALQAAMTLFWRKGYHATSLKDLEGALQMKPGSIYAAFESKETLFGLALERYYETVVAGLREALETAASPLQALADYMRKHGALLADDPARNACMLVKTVLNATPDEPEISDRARTYLNGVRDEMARGFERARSAGELPLDVDITALARQYQAHIMQLRIEAHRGTSDAELAQMAEAYAKEVEALCPATC